MTAKDQRRLLGLCRPVRRRHGADANIFHKTGKLWSPGGRLLATTTQIAYFKA